MKKIFGLLMVLVGCVTLHTVCFASSAVTASINISDVGSAELKITYPVSGQSELSVLSSSPNGPQLEQFRTLKSAYGSDGTARQVTNDNPDQDAQVSVQSSDTSVTVVYQLSNILKDSDVGLFAFPLIISSSNGSSIDSEISTSDSIRLLSYTGNSATSKLSLQKVSSDYSISHIMILVYNKSGSYVKRDSGIFSVVAPSTRIDRAYGDVTDVKFVNDVYQKIFNLSLPPKVNIVAVSLKNKSLSSYEPEGLALPQGIVLVNPDTFAYYMPTLVSKKVLAHELAHLATIPNIQFLNQPHNAKWLDEGLAVFAEQYIADNYLVKENASSNQKPQPFAHGQSYEKLTKDELKTEYGFPFDFNFSVNNSTQTIDHTYGHAGLIFYNLYLKDSSIIPRLLSYLRSANPQPSCNTCDTNTVTDKLTSLSGLSRDEIIYPFKNNLDTENQTLDTLTTNLDVVQNNTTNTNDRVTLAEVKQIATTTNTLNIKSTNIQTTIQTNPVSPVKTNTEIITPSATTSGETPSDVPVQNSDRISFIEKIWLWFSSMFKWLLGN